MKWRNHVAIVCLGVGLVAQGCAQVLGFDEPRDFGVPCTTSADCPGIGDAEVGEACTVGENCISTHCVVGLCCPTACAQGASCQTGACVCPGTNPLVCGDICKDVATDEANCGMCGTTCDIDKHEVCLSSKCEDVTWAQWPVPKPGPLSEDYKVDAPTKVVVDVVTELMWQREVDPMPRNWEEAKTYCNDLEHAGHDDWRLPTRIELVSIVDYTKTYLSINADAFPDTPIGGFWTSSPVAGSGSTAWVVRFGNGVTYGHDVTVSYRVRCVR
jgi:Protein of unknown function (DUF1566)